ncbi:outer membrane protein [Candidatus Tisiphia endosymbiont of Hybos culiciformis]|uniref:outer membrane protein n=1 Tax=Candidatus Tisiphia endosymbiont of Hybos culiciformis TaxID=3139331 RepID=UPI003CCAFFB9
MKKLLLIAATSTTLLTSVASFAETGGFYLKAEGGAIRLNELDFKKDKDKKDEGDVGKFKYIISGIAGAGAGYYIMDNVRADLTLGLLINSDFKASNTSKTDDGKEESMEVIAKESVRSLLLNGYVDLYDAGFVKFFVGAGVGMAQVEQNATATITTTSDGQTKTKTQDPESYNTANNFAYQAGAGVSFKLGDTINLDIAYSWRDYGETGDLKDDKDDKDKDKKKKETPKAAIRGHNIMAGIRFDL